MVAFPRVAGKLRLQGTSMLELEMEDFRQRKSKLSQGQTHGCPDCLYVVIAHGGDKPRQTHFPEMRLYAKFSDTSRVISETLSAARLPDSAL